MSRNSKRKPNNITPFYLRLLYPYTVPSISLEEYPKFFEGSHKGVSLTPNFTKDFEWLPKLQI
jgi:hypothetical protein